MSYGKCFESREVLMQAFLSMYDTQNKSSRSLVRTTGAGAAGGDRAVPGKWQVNGDNMAAC